MLLLVVLIGFFAYRYITSDKFSSLCGKYKINSLIYKGVNVSERLSYVINSNSKESNFVCPLFAGVTDLTIAKDETQSVSFDEPSFFFSRSDNGFGAGMYVFDFNNNVIFSYNEVDGSVRNALGSIYK